MNSTLKYSVSDFSLSILIIRHAEKAGHRWPGPGLTPEGTEDEKSLVVRGWQRAGAWATLFAGNIRDGDYPRPSVIYAADPTATTGEEPSQRPFQTVIPVAERLSLRIVTDYAVGQELELASLVTSETGVVLIAWEHNAITKTLLPAIARDQPIKGLPVRWDGERYDLVMRFDRIAPDAAVVFPPTRTTSPVRRLRQRDVLK
ncbi:MAG: hypothetical protein WAK31_14085 [Chthoniobacterales bacterium]